MAVNIHITIIELNALHTKRQNLFQELDAVIHLLMEAKHWGLRKSTHAYSIVIGSKHITLNATGGGFLTASKQFRHGATSKSRSNTASNSTKHKSPHLSGW